MKFWPCGFEIEYTHLGFASAAAVWLGLWNSDHVVLKSSIRTSASPWRQRSHWGLRVTQDAYFSLLTHTKQLLLVAFCHATAGNGAKFRTHERTDGQTDRRTDGWTDRCGSWNSYLDINIGNKILKNICVSVMLTLMSIQPRWAKSAIGIHNYIQGNG